MYRAVVVNSDVTTTSVLSSVIGGKIRTLQPGTPLSVHCNYKLDGGIVFNLMECSPVSPAMFCLLFVYHFCCFVHVAVLCSLNVFCDM